MTSVPLKDDMDHSEQLLLNDQTLIRLGRIVAKLIQDKAKSSMNIAGVTVPHDGNKTNCMFVEYEDDRPLLGQSRRAEAPLLATTKILHHSVDLSSQLSAFLFERKRTPETRSAITATITRYLSVCEAAGFPPDSRQAAAAFKKELLASGVTSRTVNFHLMRVSAFLKWAEYHGYAASDPAKGVKMHVDEEDVTERTPYSHEEVQAFVDRLDLSDHKHWLPALLIATGARLNEIAQLRCCDVGVEKGIVFIDINREADKLVKNKGSIRKVPIIDALAEQLMEHVATLIGADQDYLFPFWRASIPTQMGYCVIPRFSA